MKTVVNFVYEHGLRFLLRTIDKYISGWNKQLRKYLGYCQSGCENCYSRKCKLRTEKMVKSA